TCVCTNRFLVQAGVYDKFVEELAAASNELKVGSGLEDGVQQGPLIDEKAVEKVEELIADATAKGGKVVAGGKRHALGGSFFQPTVIADATPKMRFMKEEIFGPVAPVFKFETEEEAVALANDTEFGLAAGVFTRDLRRAHRVIAELQAGTCWINAYNLTPVEIPFGGFKQSGIGRENSLAALALYSQLKSVYVEIGDVASPY
ncbi:MAG: aldehyde dehydrogenase family protein, partial [Mesorhizobium sp.]